MSLLSRIRSFPYKSLFFGPSLAHWAGVFANKIVMAVNGGFMPVQVAGGCPADAIGGILDATHSCLTAASHLVLFADWLNFHKYTASLGDLLIDLGDAAFWPLLIAGILLLVRDRVRQPFGY
jgi:hypothetical protein